MFKALLLGFSADFLLPQWPHQWYYSKSQWSGCVRLSLSFSLSLFYMQHYSWFYFSLR